MIRRQVIRRIYVYLCIFFVLSTLLFAGRTRGEEKKITVLKKKKKENSIIFTSYYKRFVKVTQLNKIRSSARHYLN